MTFTRVWDNTAPPGTRAAAEIDNAMREFRVDIDERLAEKLFNTTMGAPATTDPATLVVRPEILGNVTGKRLYVHGVAFQVDNDESVGEYDTVGTSVEPSADPIRAWVPLPVGVTITRIQWLVTTDAAAAVTCKFGSLAFDVGLAVSQPAAYTATSSSASTRIIDTGVIATPDQITTANGFMYFLEVDQTGSAGLPHLLQIHGALILYNVPDCRNTL